MYTAVVCEKGHFKWLGIFFFSQTPFIFSILFTRILFLHFIYARKFTYVKLLSVETQSRVKRAVINGKLDKPRRLTSNFFSDNLINKGLIWSELQKQRNSFRTIKRKE